MIKNTVLSLPLSLSVFVSHSPSLSFPLYIFGITSFSLSFSIYLSPPTSFPDFAFSFFEAPIWTCHCIEARISKWLQLPVIIMIGFETVSSSLVRIFFIVGFTVTYFIRVCEVKSVMEIQIRRQMWALSTNKGRG